MLTNQAKARAIQALSERLKGMFISRFSVGDTWDMYFDGCWLSAQNLISQDEVLLNQWLQNNYQPFRKAVDQENISKCAIMAAYMRKEVTELNLDDKCNLTIVFEGNETLLLPTDTDIVDWQWSLSKSGSDPYRNYIVACFWEGEIEINGEEQMKT